MSIKAVLFDLGKVLIHFDFEPAFKKLAKHSGKSPDEIRGFFASSELEVLYDGGKISSRDFYRRVCRALGLTLSYGEFEALWNNIFKPVPGMSALVDRLERTHRLVLISNTNEMHFNFVKKHYPVLKKFSRHIVSYKEKIRKPDSRIYRKALSACKAKPHEVVYIDDREDLTSAAKELGFHVHTFKNDRPKLEQLLKKHGVL